MLNFMSWESWPLIGHKSKPHRSYSPCGLRHSVWQRSLLIFMCNEMFRLYFGMRKIMKSSFPICVCMSVCVCLCVKYAVCKCACVHVCVSVQCASLHKCARVCKCAMCVCARGNGSA